MSMNFLGLGFSFGAKDTGLGEMQDEIIEKFKTMEGSISTDFKKSATVMEQQQRRISAGFDQIGEATGRADDQAESWRDRIKGLMGAFNTFQLGDIRSKLEELGATSTNLTTGFEAQMLQHTVTAKQMATNFGYMGKEAKKFEREAASMAVRLNIDAGEAAHAVRGWTEAQDDLRAVGLKSADDLAKLSKVTGVNADVFRNSTMQMRREFKMSDEQIQKVFSSMTHMGQTTGDVSAALSELPQMMERMRKKAALMGAELDPQQLADFAASQAALSSGFFSMGQNSDQARSSAAALTDAILGSQKNLQNMTSGTADDLDTFGTELGIMTGDVTKGFQMMEEGPAGFVKGLAFMVSESKKAGRFTDQSAAFLRSRLEQAIGEDAAAQFATFFQTANEETFKMMSATETATVDMKKLAKQGFSTGRTLADQIQLAKDSMVADFRAISRESSRTFVKDASKQFKTFSKGLRAIADEGGPLGGFVKRLSEAHQLGALALVPETCRPFVAVLGDMTKYLLPVGAALAFVSAKMILIGAAVAGPILAVAGLVGWFVRLRGEGKTTGEAIEIIKEKIFGFFENLPGMIDSLLKKAGKFGRKFMALMKKIPWGEIFARASDLVSKGFMKLWGKIDWRAVNAFLVKTILKGLKFLYVDLPRLVLQHLPGALAAVLPMLAEAVGGAMNLLKELMLGALDGIQAFLMETFPQSAEKIANVFMFVKDTVSGVFDVINFLITEAIKGWGLLMGAIRDSGGVWNFIKDVFNYVYETSIKPIWDFFMWMGKTGVEVVVNSFKKVGKFIAEAFEGPLKAFETINEWIDRLFRNSIHDDVQEDMSQASKIFGRHTDTMLGDIARIQAGVDGGVTARATQTATPMAAAPAGGSVTRSDITTLIEATHMPRWYTEDFKTMAVEMLRLARQRPAEATAAVQQQGGGGAARQPASRLPNEVGLGSRLAVNAAGIPR